MKRALVFLMTFMLIFTLAACSLSNAETTTGTSVIQNSNLPASNTISYAATESSPGAASVAQALAENSAVHEVAGDYAWENSAVVPIGLDGNSINVDGDGVTVDGSTATITSPGTYSLNGSLADGQIIVSTEDEGVVRLILDGVELRSSTSAPIFVMSAEETLIVLADQTENYVSDGASYVLEDPAEDEPNAAIFSKGDLTISGNGSLTVDGNYNDGIASKDGLIIASGTLTVNSVDDGIRGKDYLVVKDGNITINAQGDGLKADNEEDATLGYLFVETGIINITSTGDALVAQTDVMIADGEFTLASGGGSNYWAGDDTSAKGVKAVVSVTIDDGTFNINSADDAIHSNGSIVINGGTFQIATADDGMHADSTLEINGGSIQVTESFEGIESAVITINAGEISIVASDDGVNVAGGNDGSGMNPGLGPGGRPGRGAGQDVFTYAGRYYLYIHDGYLVIEAAGDGIDVNGAIEMTDGVVLVNGPTERMNGALDYDASFNMTGGFLVAAGSSGMAQAPGDSSSQSSILLNFAATQKAGTLVHIQDSAGDALLTFSPTKQYQSIAFSSPELIKGATYMIYTGGSSTGTVKDGLYQDGNYTPGAQYTSFTVSGVVTRIGAAARNRP